MLCVTVHNIYYVTTIDSIWCIIGGRCVCNLFSIPGMTNGLCGLKTYDQILTEGTKLSATEIKANLLKQKAFNEGV